jgi:hypothetical protein
VLFGGLHQETCKDSVSVAPSVRGSTTQTRCSGRLASSLHLTGQGVNRHVGCRFIGQAREHARCVAL